jgi:hypothetical protein
MGDLAESLWIGDYYLGDYSFHPVSITAPPHVDSFRNEYFGLSDQNQATSV